MFEERTPEKPLDKKIAPAKQRGIWQKIYKLKADDKAKFYSPVNTQWRWG